MIARTTTATIGELVPEGALSELLTAMVEERAEGQQAVVDLYVHWGEQPVDDEQASGVLARRLAAMPFAAAVRRVAVGVVADDGREVGYFTFRPVPDGTVEEDRPVRDVHPMVGRRLSLWRLRDFELTRLEAPEDVLLLHAVARGNPQDQRLVALAQVRQLVVVRDEAGRVTALPHVERALANCLEAVRRARARLGGGARLDMNHVWLHIWPPVDGDLDQLTALHHGLHRAAQVRPAVHRLAQDGGAQVAAHQPAQRRGHPESLVVETARIEADHQTG